MWFYKLTKDSKKNYLYVEWNTQMTYFTKTIGFLGILLCMYNQSLFAIICLFCIFALLMIYLKKYGDLIKMLRIYEKNHQITYRGSKYSFKNPFIVTVFLSGIQK